MADRRDLTLPPTDQVLKRASKQLVKAFGGTLPAAEQLSQAEHRHVDHRRMSDIGNQNHAAFLRIDEAAELEELTVGTPGWPQVTRAMASRNGFALVKLPDPKVSDTIWAIRAAKLLKEGGDVITGLGSRLETGGEVDPDEAATLLPDARELLDIAMEVFEALRRRSAGEF